MLSSKVNCLFVEILAGSVERGDRLEVVRADDDTVAVVGRRVREGLAEIVLDLDDPHPAKDDLKGAAVVRSPGLTAGAKRSHPATDIA